MPTWGVCHQPEGSRVVISVRTLSTGQLIVTGAAAAARLRAAIARDPESPVEVAARASPGIRDTLALLRELDCETVLVEAGPATARALYDEPALVDELLLSVYESPELDDALVGPAIPGSGRLESLFSRHSHPVSVEESSGRWTFSRWRRDEPPARERR